MADLHCVTKFSMLGAEWGGVPARTLLDIAPPADDVTHVMVWAEYGFSSNLRLSDFLRAGPVRHPQGRRTPHRRHAGFPLRLIVPHLRLEGPQVGARRGVHDSRPARFLGRSAATTTSATPWQEQRYSYQEEPGTAPHL
ncbi:molybdopterin-dependent oxidoreductase [Streptomyces purpurascens]